MGVGEDSRKAQLFFASRWGGCGVCRFCPWVSRSQGGVPVHGLVVQPCSFLFFYSSPCVSWCLAAFACFCFRAVGTLPHRAGFPSRSRVAWPRRCANATANKVSWQALLSRTHICWSSEYAAPTSLPLRGSCCSVAVACLACRRFGLYRFRPLPLIHSRGPPPLSRPLLWRRPFRAPCLKPRVFLGAYSRMLLLSRTEFLPRSLCPTPPCSLDRCLSLSAFSRLPLVRSSFGLMGTCACHVITFDCSVHRYFPIAWKNLGDAVNRDTCSQVLVHYWAPRPPVADLALQAIAVCTCGCVITPSRSRSSLKFLSGFRVELCFGFAIDLRIRVSSHESEVLRDSYPVWFSLRFFFPDLADTSLISQSWCM